ncbi:helix-turn-helix domain-containing protein [Hymenobacter sp. BT559]|uniref:helix-turn-helix domain-containing protein n=1 Tax=Hymenobacter sp. BT559 TaxID=2795729 RepID=UPI0018EC1C2A|nr:helix-turn-helix domain-containing protein [Hymenobacter sp. BT559]MBJ6141787.1 helix-turn-helix domain-containing protein [Hymenobacter sp. BT559]
MAIIITQGVEYQQLLDDLRALIRHEMSLAKPLTEDSQQPVSDDLLTIKQAAELLDVCVATVHEHKRRGLLVYQKLGGRTYIKRSDVLAAGSREQRSQKPARARSG